MMGLVIKSYFKVIVVAIFSPQFHVFPLMTFFSSQDGEIYSLSNLQGIHFWGDCWSSESEEAFSRFYLRLNSFFMEIIQKHDFLFVKCIPSSTMLVEACLRGVSFYCLATSKFNIYMLLFRWRWEFSQFRKFDLVRWSSTSFLRNWHMVEIVGFAA